MKILYLLPVLTLIAFFNANGQAFHNLDFQRACDTSKTGLCYWDLSWGGKGAVAQDQVDRTKCLLIKGLNQNSVGFTEQSSFITTVKGGQFITVSAIIRTENVEGKGAGLNVWLFDGRGKSLISKDMGGVYSLDWIRGANNWKKYAVSVVCPPGTVKVRIGAILYGKGKAWFKNYRVNFTPIADRKPSKLATQYISAACDTIKKHSLVRDSININALKKTALRVAGPAKKYSDCYLAINYLLESLRPYGDEHSFFMKAKELVNWETNGSAVVKIQPPLYKITDSCGYILVPPFHGGNPKMMLAYADSLQLAIRKLDNADIKGWVIDLRDNSGGNQEPMIAGLGPLFSAEKLGSLVGVNQKSDAWYYKNGRYFGDGYPGWQVSNPVALKRRRPIAVLTSARTGSSGEVVTISFVGNAKTRSFGQPTWGLTTGNGSFDLADKSQIFIASTIMTDRDGKQYTGRVIPDVMIDDMKEDGADTVIKAAIAWIKSQ